MSRKLDSLDQRILDCLYRDVRISNRRIAGRLGITEGTVRSRIARMQREGQVRFTATLDASAAYQPVSGFIGVNVIGDSSARVCSALAALPQVNFVGKMLGRYDIFCSFILKSRRELADLLQATIPGIPGVKSTESLQVVEVFKFDRRWSVLGLNQGADNRGITDERQATG
jgi:Lrp/AsnC family transcriptional regulator for asnA, asnC and gidA